MGHRVALSHQEKEPAVSKPTAAADANLVAGISEAIKLGIVNGMRPVVGWFSYSPRRGAYGIRYRSIGVEPVAEDLDHGCAFSPVFDVFA